MYAGKSVSKTNQERTKGETKPRTQLYVRNVRDANPFDLASPRVPAVSPNQPAVARALRTRHTTSWASSTVFIPIRYRRCRHVPRKNPTSRPTAIRSPLGSARASRRRRAACVQIFIRDVISAASYARVKKKKTCGVSGGRPAKSCSERRKYMQETTGRKKETKKNKKKH